MVPQLISNEHLVISFVNQTLGQWEAGHIFMKHKIKFLVY